jgi:hypothetical protein
VRYELINAPKMTKNVLKNKNYIYIEKIKYQPLVKRASFRFDIDIDLIIKLFFQSKLDFCCILSHFWCVETRHPTWSNKIKQLKTNDKFLDVLMRFFERDILRRNMRRIKS